MGTQFKHEYRGKLMQRVTISFIRFSFFGMAFSLALALFPPIAVGRVALATESSPVEEWLEKQANYSIRQIRAQIGADIRVPVEAKPQRVVPLPVPGAVIAAPSLDPDYRYHWVRDAALVMNTWVSFDWMVKSADQQALAFRLLSEYVDFSRKNQTTANWSGASDDRGVGEPKFHLDGSAYNEPWGRPQNDGPALRALTLIRWAWLLIERGQENWVRQKLFDSRLPSQSVVKIDLEFISHHWKELSFDLWEETYGGHFYTRLAQRRALLEGAFLAERLNDPQAARWYRSAAEGLSRELERHWDSRAEMIRASLDVTGVGHRVQETKPSGLDTAVILAVIQTGNHWGARVTDSEFGECDPRVLITAEKISNSFRSLYLINRTVRDSKDREIAPAIGRYPEDRYAGTTGLEGGNPWFLTTHAMSELYYRCSTQLDRRKAEIWTSASIPLLGKLQIFKGIEVRELNATTLRKMALALREAGDAFLRRSQLYSFPQGGAMAEQFNRDTGKMQSAEELTWSHASILTAYWARNASHPSQTSE